MLQQIQELQRESARLLGLLVAVKYPHPAFQLSTSIHYMIGSLYKSLKLNDLSTLFLHRRHKEGMMGASPPRMVPFYPPPLATFKTYHKHKTYIHTKARIGKAKKASVANLR